MNKKELFMKNIKIVENYLLISMHGAKRIRAEFQRKEALKKTCVHCGASYTLSNESRHFKSKNCTTARLANNEADLYTY